MNPNDNEIKRGVWKNKGLYLITQISSAIGLGNLIRFPYLAFKNGGGAFLIPYLLSLIFLAIPVFILELSMGQIYRQGIIGAMKKINERAIGVGIYHIFTTMAILSYYCTIITWILWYLMASCESTLPFASQPEYYFLKEFLDVATPGSEIKMNLFLLVFLALVWILIFVSISYGINSSSYISPILFPTSLLLLLILLIRGITLEGASYGIYYYLKPDFSKLASASIWLDASSQVFFSVGLAGGVIPSLASYTKGRQDIVLDALLIAGTNCMIELLCGFIVFSYLGNLAFTTKRDILQVVAGGYDLSFVVFPEALSKMPFPNLFAILFFLTLFILGIMSAFAMTQTLTTAIYDKWEHCNKPLISSLVCLFGFSTGLIYILNIGYFLVDIVDHYTSMMLLIGGILECGVISFSYVRGKKSSSNQIFFDYSDSQGETTFLNKEEKLSTSEYFRLIINDYTKIKLPKFWSLLIGLVIPVFVILILLTTIILKVNYNGYPFWMQITFGWFPFTINLLLVILFIIKPTIQEWIKTRKTNSYTQLTIN